MKSLPRVEFPSFCSSANPKYYSNECESIKFLEDILTILTGKAVFYLIQYEDDCLTASDLFHIFTHIYTFNKVLYISLSNINEYRSTRMTAWLLLTFFICLHIFTQSIKFCTFLYQILKSTDVWKIVFIKQTVKMNGCSFQQVLRQNLILLKNRFF